MYCTLQCIKHVIHTEGGDYGDGIILYSMLEAFVKRIEASSGTFMSNIGNL